MTTCEQTVSFPHIEREQNDFSQIDQEHFLHRFSTTKELLDDSFDTLEDLSETYSIKYELDRKTMTYIPVFPSEDNSTLSLSSASQ